MWLLFVAWGVAIIWLSLIPAPPGIENPLLGWDKLQHAAAYGLLTLLGFLALGSLIPYPRRWALSAMLLAILFGALMEAAQGLFTATRTAEAGDLLADAVGAMLIYGAVTWRTWTRKN